MFKHTSTTSIASQFHSFHNTTAKC